ncbi:MAG: CDP-alcohol phosphatidyltransferase family protein [candidate division WOR-3 bacterium]
MNENFKKFGRQLLLPVTDLLIKIKITPNTITLLGLPVTLLASYFYAIGKLRIAGLTLAFAGLFDVLDGEVARRLNRVSKFGAFFDSTIDRFEEFFVFGGIIYYYSFVSANPLFAILVYFTLLGAIMTSYIRARAEGVGYSPQSGPMDRPGRYIFIIIFSVIGGETFKYSMFVLLILVFITVVNRFREFYLITNKEEQHG